ncbi:DUF934 domain-containing protein [Aquisalimonas lutea]|uniref:DUF934 domain-containing protein n=1 Tax=Aquisalimonas lutea TaxID=1327750 RepID=UPI0025B4FF55|nr:DUF934 domain-containing protein [Aquisalimonas lutea]MDN3518421.1 DUF934 domain-containing protein [Aquisalimonas lutea]
MRRMIRHGGIIEDHWLHVADDDALPEGDVIVTEARWHAERETLLARDGCIGVRIHGDTDLSALAPDLDSLAVIALEFPAFKDGRCLSQARLLRERFGYSGELRAVGDVLRDQLAYMARVGIDAFEVRADRSLEDALRAFEEFSGHYQLNPVGRSPRELRRERAAPARTAAAS